MWKGEFGPLKEIFGESNKERLRLLARREPHIRKDFESVFPFYCAKIMGKMPQTRIQVGNYIPR
jgi:hypothetical protein